MSLTTSSPRHALLAALCALVVAAALLAPVPAAAQQTTPEQPAGEVSADLVTVHDTSLLGELDVAEVEVGRARGSLGADLAAVDSDGDVEAHALANNVNASVLGALNLEDELLVQAQQASPPDEPAADTDELLDLPLNPVLAASVARTSARALTGGGSGCAAFGEPYTDASADLAGVGVLPGAVDDSPLLGLTGRGDDDVVTSNTTIERVDHDAVAGDAVRASASADLAAVELAGYHIGVVSQPHLAVTSSGPGDGFADAQAAMDAGALEWTAPVVEIRDPQDQVVATLDAGQDVNDSFTIPGVATISLGTVELTADGSDGELAAEGELLRLEIAEVLGQIVNTDVAIAPLTTSATTPDGGIDCDEPEPLEGVTKEVSQETVAPGDTFTYTIAIPNLDSACTLTDVTVVDEIGGVDGLQIAATTPEADEVDGTTVTWDDVGPIGPESQTELTIDVAVPDDAAEGTISESLTIDALCGDETTDAQIDFDGPEVVDDGTGDDGTGDDGTDGDGTDGDGTDGDEPTRVDGPTRVETGVEVSEQAFESATAAVVARSDKFPDALTASALAAEVDGPILVNPPQALRDDVAAELQRLGVEDVYLAGGTGALSAQVEQDVADLGLTPIRLDGNTRYHTAELIAREVADLGGPVRNVVLARDDLFPDALSAGNLATWARSPILLTRPDQLHANAEQVMTDSEVVAQREAFIAGGAGAISQGVAGDLRAREFAVERLSGAERYATAVAITQRAVEGTNATLDPLYAATGRDFADALVAAPAAYHDGGALTLVDGVDYAVSHATDDFLAAHRDAIGQLTIVGGTAAISDHVVQQMQTTLNQP